MIGNINLYFYLKQQAKIGNKLDNLFKINRYFSFKINTLIPIEKLLAEAVFLNNISKF